MASPARTSDRLKSRPLPPKGKKVRRAGVRTANAYRKYRRFKAKTKIRAKKALDHMGAQYKCMTCDQMVPYRRADEHNRRHSRERAKRVNQIDKEIKKIDNKSAEPTKVNTTKARARKQRAPQLPDNVTPIRKDTDTTGASRTSWKAQIDRAGDDMAGKNGSSNTRSSSLAGNVARAFQAWAEYEPTTYEELRAHLVEMDAALSVGSDAVAAFASDKIVGKQIHPLVARPIDAWAQNQASDRHLLTQAIQTFDRVYENHLAAARQDGPKPKADFFNNVG